MCPVAGLERMTTGSVVKRITYCATQVDSCKPTLIICFVRLIYFSSSGTLELFIIELFIDEPQYVS